ncbi:hypothetical protein [Streptomyces fagopyri]|uniref:hypothetical protein n=1 Tax=Streptomyces fagopyri TaxID=2662397 RepID=UPI00371CE36A
MTTDQRSSRAGIIGHDYPRLTPEPIVSPESINVMDPPHSSRVRQPASQAFTQQQVDSMRHRIVRLADLLLDEMEEEGPPADLVQHLSHTLPQHTVLDLLAIEREEWPWMQESVRQLLVVGADNKEAAAKAKADLTAHFAELVEQRRNSTGQDLISVMAEARDGEDHLDDNEPAVMALTPALSGQDTATCRISNIVYLLLTRPEPAEHLRGWPETLTDVPHEMLRCIPFRKGVGIPRVALEHVELDGLRIRAGDFVHRTGCCRLRPPKGTGVGASSGRREDSVEAVHGVRPDGTRTRSTPGSVEGGSGPSGVVRPRTDPSSRARSAAVRQRRPNARITVWCTALPAESSALALSDT